MVPPQDVMENMPTFARLSASPVMKANLDSGVLSKPSSADSSGPPLATPPAQPGALRAADERAYTTAVGAADPKADERAGKGEEEDNTEMRSSTKEMEADRRSTNRTKDANGKKRYEVSYRIILGQRCKPTVHFCMDLGAVGYPAILWLLGKACMRGSMVSLFEGKIIGNKCPIRYQYH